MTAITTNDDASCYCAPKTSVGKAIFWSKITAGGSVILVSISPYISKITGIQRQWAEWVEPIGLCGGGNSARGIIGEVSQNIPQSGFLNPIIACAAIIGGKFLHNYLAERDRPKLGKIASGTSTVVGMAAVAPAILESLNQGSKFLLAAGGSPEIAVDLNNIMGTSGMDTQSSGAVIAFLSSHIGCLMSALAAFASTFIPIKCKNNKSNFDSDSAISEWVNRTQASAPPVKFSPPSM